MGKNKINKRIAFKLQVMADYLETEISGGHIFTGDQDYTRLDLIRKVYIDAIGYNFKGYAPAESKPYREIIPFCHGREVHYIYSACRRADRDFGEFCKNYGNN